MTPLSQWIPNKKLEFSTNVSRHFLDLKYFGAACWMIKPFDIRCQRIFEFVRLVNSFSTFSQFIRIRKWYEFFGIVKESNWIAGNNRGRVALHSQGALPGKFNFSRKNNCNNIFQKSVYSESPWSKNWAKNSFDQIWIYCFSFSVLKMKSTVPQVLQ